MTKTELQREVLDLPPEERIELGGLIRRSLEEAPLTDWQKQLIDERLAEDERNPDGALPGEELLVRLRRSPA